MRELMGSLGWQLLKKTLLEQKQRIPEVKDADSKEAFFYWAIRNQAIDELINLPQELVDGYERGNNRRTQ